MITVRTRIGYGGSACTLVVNNYKFDYNHINYTIEFCARVGLLLVEANIGADFFSGYKLTF